MADEAQRKLFTSSRKPRVKKGLLRPRTRSEDKKQLMLLAETKTLPCFKNEAGLVVAKAIREVRVRGCIVYLFQYNHIPFSKHTPPLSPRAIIGKLNSHGFDPVPSTFLPDMIKQNLFKHFERSRVFALYPIDKGSAKAACYIDGVWVTQRLLVTAGYINETTDLFLFSPRAQKKWRYNESRDPLFR